jgi:hypothetical protein
MVDVRTWGLGAILALIVLIAAFVLALMGTLTWLVAGMFIALAIARLV